MKKLKKFLPVITGIAIGFAAVFFTFVINRHDALIALENGMFMRCSFSFSVYDRVIYFNSSDYQTKESALSGESGHSLGLVSTDKIKYIEFIHPEPADELSPLPDTPADSVDFPYAGNYKFNANGNDGILTVVKGEKGYYGTIRFPNWGKGATEYLKRLSFKGRRIYFVRSVTTREEITRTGASTYFTQEYYGEFSTDGTLASGQYIIRGAKNQWNAIRIKR